MKYILTLALGMALLQSCGGDKQSGGGSAAELAKLKKERSDLDQKISKLEDKAPDTSRKATPVTVMSVEPETFHAYIEIQSQITGEGNVNATSQMPGVVRTITVKAGQRVSKGQVMATLDAASVDQQVQAQDAQLELVKTLYEKQQRLWAQNIGTQVQLLQAKTNYEAMQRQRDATIAQRNMFRVIAPTSGVVDMVNMKVGDAVAPGSPASYIRVVNNDKLKAEANLGENYIGQVRAGDDVTLVFPDLKDSIHTKLTYVSQAVDPISRSFHVEIRMGASAKLRPNMSCIMRITNYNAAAALVVPSSVIQTTATGQTLFTVESGKAKSLAVTTGRTANGMVEVLSGLKAGDQVVTQGFEDLDTGEPVKIQ